MDYFLAIGDLPDSIFKVAGPPVLLSMIAAAIWLSGRTAQLKQGVGPWKWWAAVPMALALLLGWRPFDKLQDFLYRDAIEMLGSRMEMAHYAAFLFPTASIIGLALYEILERRAARLQAER